MTAALGEKFQQTGHVHYVCVFFAEATFRGELIVCPRFTRGSG